MPAELELEEERVPAGRVPAESTSGAEHVLPLAILEALAPSAPALSSWLLYLVNLHYLSIP